ncbi:hypothetical protein [Sandaracinus amylolyticus]|uniref:Uncharacterized protein n=1 Tax=Sandaracinus amylolyticus TaxID=927083 RepID=A0A0F6SHG3_9BACT|nr:hypothetical protein [Sandaracinus amylolyticus]AKF10394.1 hypothetical protein DB32_007543 [Sandaracinus amylolyticus]
MIDWDALRSGRVDGRSARVRGARIGDAIGAIELDASVRYESIASGPRSHGTDGAFDILPDGRRVPVSPETLREEVAARGGRVFVAGTTFELRDGVVRRIWVRGPGLEALRIRAEEEIDRAFGRPDGVELVLGWRVHHFFAAAISIAWDAATARVEHVAFGEVIWRPRVLGAIDVLHEWLGSPLAGDPTARAPSDGSLAVRHARVNALLRAFELGSPQSFARGEFLRARALDAHPRALARLAKHAGDRRPRDFSLVILFTTLMRYRRDADRVVRGSEGWLEAGDAGVLTALALQDRASRALGAALVDIDDVLAELIAPDGRTFTEPDLVARWGWPDVDLLHLRAQEL